MAGMMTTAALTVPEVTVCTLPNWYRPTERDVRRRRWQPGLRVRDVIPPGFIAQVNGIVSEADTPLTAGDHVFATKMVGGSTGKKILDFSKTIWGIVLLPVVYGKEALQYILPGTPSRPRSNDPGTVYSWTGITSNYSPLGLPYPLVYGRHRVGGAILAAYVDVEASSPPVSKLHLLLAVSLGPIQSIGGFTEDQNDLQGDQLPSTLQINGNAASSYDGVRLWLRMGTSEQDTIPGFNFLPTQHTVGILIDAPEEDPPATDWSEATSFEFPQGTQADRMIVGINFPNGLFRYNSNGELRLTEAQFQMRYTHISEADGTPINTPVDVYFGASTTLTLEEKFLNAFTHQVSVPLYDPDTIVVPTVTNAIQYSGTQWAESLVSSGFPTGVQTPALSVVMFVRLDNADQTNPIFEWGDGTGSGFGGLRLWATNTVTNEADLNVRIDDGVTDTTISGIGLLNEGEWHMVGITFQQNAVAGLNRLRVYVDGNMERESLISSQLVFPSPIGWFRLNTLDDGASQGDVTYDEIRLYDVERTISEMSASWNNGAPVGASNSDADLVTGWRMDTTSGGVVFGPFGQPFAQQAGTPTVVTGLVTTTPPPGSNETLRARYLVEIQRVNNMLDDKANVSDRAIFDHVITILDEDVAYTGVALIGLEITATDQLSGAAPDVTEIVEGVADCPIWDGINPDFPSFSLGHSTNLAWQVTHLLTSDVSIGSASYLTSDVDWPAFKAWADWMDTLVYDRRGAWTITQMEQATEAVYGLVLKLRAAGQLPDHLTIGHHITITQLTASLEGLWPQGTYEIVNRVNVSATEWEVWVAYPTGAANLCVKPTQFDEPQWLKLGANPITLSVADTPDYIPPFTSNAVAEIFDVQDWTTGTNTLRQTFSAMGEGTAWNLLNGQVYNMSLYVRVLDALGPIDVLMDMGDQPSTTQQVPDDGGWTRVAADYVWTTGGSAWIDFSFRDMDSNRQIAIAGAMFKVGANVADWDETFTPGTNPVTGSLAIMHGSERRFEGHMVLSERGRRFWDVAIEMAALGRASLITIGQTVSVKYEEARLPVAVFTDANIIAGSFRLISSRPNDRSNSVVVEFQDQERDYDRNALPVDHPSIQEQTSTIKIRRKTMDMRGATNASQVSREADFVLAVNDLVDTQVEFEVGVDGAFVLPGDVFVLQHNVPRWAVGGKTRDDATFNRQLLIDLPVTIGDGNPNMADWSEAMENWNLLLQSTVTDDVAVEPPDHADATTLYEPNNDGGNVHASNACGFWLPIHDIKPSTTYSWQISAKVPGLYSGTTAKASIQLWDSAAPASVTSVSFTLSDTWQTKTISTTTPSSLSGYEQLRVWFRVDSGQTYPRPCHLSAAFLYDGTGSPAYQRQDASPGIQAYASVRNSQTDEVFTVPVAEYERGTKTASEYLLLDATLGHNPIQGSMWAVGSLETASRLFNATETELSTDMRKIIRAANYDENVYPNDVIVDVDDVPVIASTADPQTTPGGLSNPSAIPSIARVYAREETGIDETTGQQFTGVVVGWQYDTAAARTGLRNPAPGSTVNVWVEEVGAGRAEQVASGLRLDEALHRINRERYQFDRETTYRVTVQGVARDGTRSPLARSASALLRVHGLSVVPQAVPDSLSVVLSGHRASYYATLADARSLVSVAFVRGSPSLSQEIATVPVSSARYGPTDDWAALPTAVDGRGDVPVYAALVGPSGLRGDWIKLTTALDPDNFGAAFADVSWEDETNWAGTPSGWSTAPALADLEVVDDDPLGGVHRLAFDDMSSALTGTYTTSIHDIGRARAFHLSIALDGFQVPPETIDGMTEPISGVRQRSYTANGYTDSRHPDYDRLDVELQWRYSLTSGTPDSGWQRIRPGFVTARSFQFRISITRPDATWDVRIDRLACACRIEPTSDSVLNDLVTS